MNIQCVCWCVCLGDVGHQDSGSHFLLHQIRSPTAAAKTPAQASLPLMSDVDRIPTIKKKENRGCDLFRVYSPLTQICVSVRSVRHICV